MKSVCILVQNYYEMDIRVRRKAEALVAAGFGVDVLALASSYSEAKNYTLNGVNVHTLALGKKRRSLARYAFEYVAFFLWAFFKLIVLTGQKRYSIIEANTLPDFLVFAAAYAKLRGAKVLLDMHEITPEFYVSKYKIKEDSVLVWLLKFIEKASFNFADHVLTINEPIQKLLESRGLPASKTTVIMNAVDESLFAGAAGASVAADNRTAQGMFTMMYHGTLTHIYGVDIAIEAFGMARNEMPGAELWILGNGPEKETLENLARKLGLDGKVKFIGNVPPEEVPQWLKCCDAGVLATRRDVFLDYSFSNKLSECIVMGKSVIVSRLKTIRHYFSEEAFAFFEPNDPSDLARRMVRLYENPVLRRQLAEQARLEYAPIRWEVMKGRYLACVDQLVGSRHDVKPESAAAVSSAARSQ